MNTRRDFLRTAGLAAPALFFPSPSGAKTRRPPNIIFLLADDLSYRDLGCLGQDWIETPNLDRLYRESMRFTNGYAGAPECAPSRCGLMTGLHMGHARIRLNSSVRGQDHLEPGDVTVADVLKQAGYATGFVGKWGIGTPGTAGVPYKHGFDSCFGFYDQVTAHGYFPDSLYRNEALVDFPENHGYDMAKTYSHTKDDSAHHYDSRGKFIPPGLPDPTHFAYAEYLFRAEALKFIRQNQSRPFFLYYATTLPHGPVVAPDLMQYRNRDFPDLRHKEWAAMVTILDQSCALIENLLKELRLDDNTVIFFAGDNGYSAWIYLNNPRHQDDRFFHNKGPWRGGKFEAREGGLRVPFLVRWPGHIKPGDTDHLCAFWDFMPTAAELAGTRAPANDGFSIVPVLTGQPEKQKQHEYLYWERSHEQAVRIGRYHAFREHPSKPTELYDIILDPVCTRDIAAQQPQLVAKIERIFKEAHTDSEWYVNPGASPASVQAKREKAKNAGQTIQSTKPNGLP